MLKRSLLLAILACGASLAFAQSTNAKLEEYMSAHAKLQRFNGVVLVAKGGQVLLHKGYGWRDAHKRIPHNENSIFQIGSVTKQFTATIILHLQEQGKLSVQDKLSKYIPGYPVGDNITIEHLLTHTSGIFNYTNDSKFMSLEPDKPIAIEKLIGVFRDRPRGFAPGTKYSYSNSGYILLGHIIHKVSGKPYEQMVREVIFRPLKMQKSGFDFRGLKDSGKSTGYFVLDSDTTPALIVDSTVSYAAGSIYSTATDLYKWHKGLYGEEVIKQSSLEKAFTPYKSDYGYGWMIDSINKKRIITHNGDIFGFSADMLRVPEDDVCIILLSNKPAELEVMTRNLLHILYNLPYEIPKERPAIQVPAQVLQQYAGEYEVQPGFIITITVENGKLMGQATNQSKFELFAQRENFFFLKVVDAQVEFVKGADGKIEKLILHQGGMKQPGKKIR